MTFMNRIRDLGGLGEENTMYRTRLIARQEFHRHVRRRGFIISTLALPIILIFVSLLANTVGGAASPPLQELQETKRGSVGFVDEAQLVHTLPPSLPEGALVRYLGRRAAREALEAGAIDAYFVIPQDYRETGNLQRVSKGLPLTPADAEAFQWLLISNLFPERGPQEVARLHWPFDGELEYVSVDPDGAQSGPLGSLVPLGVAMVIMLPLFSSGSLLYQSLVKEKEKRVLEILLASAAPRDLLAGKLIGFGAVVLVQYALWLLIGAVAVVVAGLNPLEHLGALHLSTWEPAIILSYVVGSFTLYAGIMAGLGALMPDAAGNHASLTLFLVGLPTALPIYLISAITGAPNGPLATALSLFPLSAPITMIVRMTSTTVPAWQIAFSLSLLFVTAVGTLRLMARLFRAKTLLSGESLSLRRFASAVAEG
jgi:ABC-2 type transport system permease protein